MASSNFMGASADDACFDNAILERSNFSSATLDDATFHEANISRCNFSRTIKKTVRASVKKI